MMRCRPSPRPALVGCWLASAPTAQDMSTARLLSTLSTGPRAVSVTRRLQMHLRSSLGDAEGPTGTMGLRQ